MRQRRRALPEILYAIGVEQVKEIRKEQHLMVSKYYKSLIAFVGIVVTTVGSVAADPDISGALPTGWGATVAAAGAVVTTWLVWLKKNEPTVTEAEKVLQDARNRAGI